MPGTADAAFDALGRDEIVNAFYAITWWRSLHARPLSSVAAGLRYHVAQEDGEVDGRIDVTQRLKRRNTIIGKLTREPSMESHSSTTLAGFGHAFPVSRTCMQLADAYVRPGPSSRRGIYFANPKPSGYRALHVIARRDDFAIEVQLRTVRQDAWANQVEDDGRQIGIGLKFGAGATDIHDYYVAISEAFALLDRGEPLPDELVAILNERYAIIKGTLPRQQQ